MVFETVADFLAMGKHGVYVWSAYGVTAALWLGLICQLRLRRRKVINDIARELRRAEVSHAQTDPTEVL